MQEMVGTAFNASLVEGVDGTLIGACEVIVVVSEPIYRMDGAGGMNRLRELSQLRFGSTAKGLREMIERLGEYADTLEGLESRASLKGAAPVAKAT